MRRKRRTHSPEFKAKVALAAIQGDLTMAELIRKFDVHANQITDWKKQLLSNAPDVFGNGAKKTEDATKETGIQDWNHGECMSRAQDWPAMTMENRYFPERAALTPFTAFTGPEERNGRLEGSTADDPSMRVTGSATLDVLSRAQAGLRRGAGADGANRPLSPETPLLRQSSYPRLARGS